MVTYISGLSSSLIERLSKGKATVLGSLQQKRICEKFSAVGARGHGRWQTDRARACRLAGGILFGMVRQGKNSITGAVPREKKIVKGSPQVVTYGLASSLIRKGSKVSYQI